MEQSKRGLGDIHSKEWTHSSEKPLWLCVSAADGEGVFILSARSEVSPGQEDFSLIPTSSVLLFSPSHNPSNLCCHHWPQPQTHPRPTASDSAATTTNTASSSLQHLHHPNPVHTKTHAHTMAGRGSRQRLGVERFVNKARNQPVFFMYCKIQRLVPWRKRGRLCGINTSARVWSSYLLRFCHRTIEEIEFLGFVFHYTDLCVTQQNKGL